MASWRPLPAALRYASLHGRGATWRGCSAPIGAVQPLLRQTSTRRCLATEAAEEPAAGSKDNAGVPTAVKAAVAIAAVGGAAWAVAPWFWSEDKIRSLNAPSSGPGPDRSDGRGVVMPISDDIFDTEDNLFVFFLDKPEEVLGRREEIDRVLKPLLAEESLSRLRFFHNVRHEGDPAVPQGEGAEAGEKPLKAVMYKGQRKVVINIGAEVPLQQILEFYKPLSEVLSSAAGQLNKEQLVQRVSGNAFREEVVMKSSPERWVLVQMYEDTCFLCFLMRPFVNTLAALLKEQDMPITIRRLNVSENDFPESCPVARGTPTFVLYRGPKVPAIKWEEFKPQDLVTKLSKELPAMDEEIYAKMQDYQELVSNRFRLFTQIVFWTVELSKLQTIISAPEPVTIPGGAGGQKEKEDTDFNTVVASMMGRDMKRIDGIHDNLKHLQSEVDEVEHDCAVLGMMLGGSLLERERQLGPA